MSNAISQAPGFYRFYVGQTLVTTLNDGFLPGSFEIMNGIAPDDARALMAAAYQLGPRIALNAFLVETNEHKILVDTGGGTKVGPTGGLLLGNLQSAGVAPTDIDLVLMTHLHRDHAGGLTDGAGKAVFPNAKVLVPEVEAAFWFDEAHLDETPKSTQVTFAIAREVRAAYEGRIETFGDGQEVAPGIRSESLPGHTPGHTGFHLLSEGQALFIWGDIVHMPVLQSARPGVATAFDNDPSGAEAVRRKVLKQAADEATHVAGMHMLFPGAGHVIHRDGAYMIIPDVWTSLVAPT